MLAAVEVVVNATHENPLTLGRAVTKYYVTLVNSGKGLVASVTCYWTVLNG